MDIKIGMMGIDGFGGKCAGRVESLGLVVFLSNFGGEGGWWGKGEKAGGARKEAVACLLEDWLYACRVRDWRGERRGF